MQGSLNLTPSNNQSQKYEGISTTYKGPIHGKFEKIIQRLGRSPLLQDETKGLFGLGSIQTSYQVQIT